MSLHVCKTSDPRGGAIFYPRAILLTVLVKDQVPNVKGLGLLVSLKKIFKVFPHTSLCKTSHFRDGAILTPEP